MSRQNAREAAVRFLYQADITGDDPASVIESYFHNIQPDDEDVYIPLGDEDIDYTNSLLSGVSEHIDEIDGIISANSNGWKINRISKTLLAVMRIAVFEMKYRDDVPAKVSINEAIELAKAYDGEATGAFVSGILAGAVRSLGILNDE